VGIRELQPVDVIAGGFPCQDISNAGKRVGIGGERSGLWSEFSRIIGELRPHFVLVENVAALLVRGIDTVLGDLAAIGYDAEWQIISAADMGAPHLRRRIWIVAYPHGSGFGQPNIFGQQQGRAESFGSREDLAYSDFPRLERRERKGLQEHGREWVARTSNPCEIPNSGRTESDRWADWTCGWEREPQETLCDARRDGRSAAWQSIPESLLGRVADGVPYRVDRLGSLGNAVVPQIPEMIARRMIQHFQEVSQ
jgi:DNA (cytosine-5)-methyltransferase 1